MNIFLTNRGKGTRPCTTFKLVPLQELNEQFPVFFSSWNWKTICFRCYNCFHYLITSSSAAAFWLCRGRLSTSADFLMSQRPLPKTSSLSTRQVSRLHRRHDSDEDEKTAKFVRVCLIELVLLLTLRMHKTEQTLFHLN
ncbi:unnamed protein product [Orchesella dallaii]|uniref:Uncharacterized protein n=1 Tax=Orchesella dallaii TaxID=48710 RepID=A0ABP1PP65_9HEXA